MHTVAQPATASDATTEASLWALWRGQGCTASRERLVFLHLELARILAAKLYKTRRAAGIAFAEYMQFATVGLLEAIDRYDPQSPAAFRTYAVQRINGAMFDGLARLTEQGQQIALHQRMLAERTASLKARAGDAAGEREAGDAGQVFHDLADIAIGLALGFMLDDSSMLDAGQERDTQLYSSLELRQLQARVRELVERLPQRERMVIKYHYMHQFSFETVAGIFKISKGRVSQIHHRALFQLRKEASRVPRCDLAW